IAEATAAARDSAQQFAQDSGSRLGGIRSANQGVVTISDRDQSSRHVKRVRVVTTVEYFLRDCPEVTRPRTAPAGPPRPPRARYAVPPAVSPVPRRGFRHRCKDRGRPARPLAPPAVLPAPRPAPRPSRACAGCPCAAWVQRPGRARG